MSEAVAGMGLPTAGTAPAAGRRFVVVAALSTLFEWYDFYVYVVLATMVVAHLFPTGSDTTALLAAFAIYAVGFLARPAGAVLFGRLADRQGRKLSFTAALLLIGVSSLMVGLLPEYSSIGWLAPVLLLLLRGLQGLGFGGGYGGGASFIAEHALARGRGQATGWLQAAGSIGFMLALLVLALCRHLLGQETFAAWGWRIPFLFSALVLPLYAYARWQLDETPVFLRMQAEGRRSDAPWRESFFSYPNNRQVILALLGATAGPAVIWYTGHFYALSFLTSILKLDQLAAYMLLGAALLICAPGFVFFGWLSDRIGRLKIIMAGCLLAAITYFPLFSALGHAVNPALAGYQERTPIGIAAAECSFRLVLPGSELSACDQARDFLIKAGLTFHTVAPVSGVPLVVRIGTSEIQGFDPPKLHAALRDTGYPLRADPAQINYPLALLILVLLLLYVGMVFGPLTALLVEMFPARIRTTSLSLPFQLGHGWFGSLLPPLATAMVAATGNVFMGLWYPIAIAVMSLVVGSLFLRDKLGRDLHA